MQKPSMAAQASQIPGSTQAPTGTSVKNQLGSMLDSNSAYMTQAKNQGEQVARSRGLGNTSMAGQAAQGAAINSAAPIAQQEASNELNKWNAEESRNQQAWQLQNTVSANLQGKYTDQVNDMMRNSSISINEIETNSNLTPEQKNKMTENTIARRDSDMAFMRNMFSAMPTWQTNWGTLPSMPSAPGVSK